MILRARYKVWRKLFRAAPIAIDPLTPISLIGMSSPFLARFGGRHHVSLHGQDADHFIQFAHRIRHAQVYRLVILSSR